MVIKEDIEKILKEHFKSNEVETYIAPLTSIYYSEDYWFLNVRTSEKGKHGSIKYKLNNKKALKEIKKALRVKEQWEEYFKFYLNEKGGE